MWKRWYSHGKYWNFNSSWLSKPQRLIANNTWVAVGHLPKTVTLYCRLPVVQLLSVHHWYDTECFKNSIQTDDIHVYIYSLFI
jgi:hypothetical protein